MDDCYQPIQSALLTRNPLAEVKDAYTTVSREESHKGIPESSSVSEYKLNATSFAAKSFNNNRRNFNNNTNNKRGFTSNNNVNRGPNPSLNCKNCGKVGHTIDRCFEIVGFPPGNKRNTNIVKQGFSANTKVKLNDKISSSSLSSGFTSEQMFYYANSKLYAQTITLGWIIDLGANQHLTVSTVGMFNVMNITSLKIPVSHPNMSLATISHVGNLKLSNNVILYDVIDVPVYCVTLLSVNKLIRDRKMFVGFDKDKCYIQDLKIDTVLGIGSESGGLYLFDMNKDNAISKSNMVICFDVSKLLWHNRLGHPADQVKMDNLNITMEEYVRLEEEKARRRSMVYNWETATYVKIWDNEDVHDLGYVETEFLAIVFKTLTTKAHTCVSIRINMAYLGNRYGVSTSYEVLGPSGSYRQSWLKVLYKVEDIATYLVEYVKFWDDWEVDRYGNANLGYAPGLTSYMDIADGLLIVLTSRLTSSVLKDKSPYELVFKNKPSLSYLRDVKFYEIVFPCKMKSKESIDVEYASETDHLTLFDNQKPQRPYDDGRATSVDDGSVPFSRHNSTDTTLCQEEYTTTQIDDQSSS
ncbi:hypothetical protein Tco_0382345 [Tanacetum coccineum]